MHSSRPHTAALLCCLLLLLPAAARAQQASVVTREVYRLERLDRPGWLNGTGLFAVNALLGGVSTGLMSQLRGGSFRHGFAAGSAAGGVVYAGKVVAVQRFPGAGLVGRQLANIGGSAAANVARGAPVLSRIDVPFGPVRLVVSPGERRLAARFDPVGVAVLAWAVASPAFELDAGASLSSGTPVFRTGAPVMTVPISGASAAGMQFASVILLGDMREFDTAAAADVFAHERVHTLQADAFQEMWGRALLEWVTPDSPGWRKAVGVIDLNLGKGTAELFDHLLWRRGLWEIEADFIGRN